MTEARPNRRSARTAVVTERVYEQLPSGNGRRLKYYAGQRITAAEAEAAGIAESGESADGVSDKARRPRSAKTKTDG